MASSQDSDSLRRFHSLLPSSDSSLPSPRPWASSFASTTAIREFHDKDFACESSLDWIRADSQANRNRVKRMHRQFREDVKVAKKTVAQTREKRKVQKALFRRLNRSLDRLVEDTVKTSNLVEIREVQRKLELKVREVQVLGRPETRCSSCRLF